jgi:ABC-type sugar transport system permease subunit
MEHPDSLYSPPSTALDSRRVRRSFRGYWLEIRRSLQAYALLSPIFFLLIVFLYYPPLLGLVRSFYKWAPGREPVYVGLANFQAYFAYPVTQGEIVNMVKLLGFGLFAQVVVPFVMAELIFSVRSTGPKEAYRLMTIIPLLVPGIVVTLLWKHIYDPHFGPINALLKGVGLDMLARNWLGDPATALYAIMGVGFPWVSSIATLIYLSGLGQISQSIYDSCALDGCAGLRRVLRMDLPLVLGQVRLLLVLAVIHALTVFESILVLTDGGPGYATMVPAMTMYKRAFVYLEFGHASAVGLMLFVIAMGLTLVINRTVRPSTK